ncbi:MAG TPA: hypothetical protein VHY82_16015 [Acetobacteraceae bacterium]|jgi:hypothetical protein|nr:hypothetical protein [Acetobacteraceae bacterium]
MARQRTVKSLRARAVAAPLGYAPTAELRRWFLIEPPEISAKVFRQYHRRLSRLGRLHASGQIDADELDAGRRFRTIYEIADGARDGGGELVKVDGKSLPSGPSGQQLDAIAELRRVEEQFGRLTWLLVACCVKDRSWPDIGRRAGVDHETAQAWTVAVLKELARYYAGREAAKSLRLTIANDRG